MVGVSFLHTLAGERALGAGLVLGHIGENEILENTAVRPSLARENATRRDIAPRLLTVITPPSTGSSFPVLASHRR